jgi:death-on-curing protein
MPGVRDTDALEAVLARPRQKWHYDADSDLAGLAAAYAFGLATTHPFNDGNKRMSLLTMAVFLGLNGKALDATEPELVQVITALSAGSLKEPQLAAWVRDHIVRLGL